MNVKGFVGISYNARNVMDSSWQKFVQMLFYKVERAGETVVKVELRGTTQKDSGCGIVEIEPLLCLEQVQLQKQEAPCENQE